MSLTEPGLKRYWFEFDLTLEDEHPAGVLLGCGVTARGYDDALSLLRKVARRRLLTT